MGIGKLWDEFPGKMNEIQFSRGLENYGISSLRRGLENNGMNSR
jgi:hypothetical protein